MTLIYFLIWGLVILFLMRVGCGSHVMGHGHSHATSTNPPDKDIDPVCGMTVETATAKSNVLHGHTYYFCSRECREKFEAAPEGYLSGGARSAHTMEMSHDHQH